MLFPMICGSGGSKSRLAKAAGAEPSRPMRNKTLHTVVARSTFPSQNLKNQTENVEKLHAAIARTHFQVKMFKTPQLRSTFGSFDVEKWHATWRETHFEVKMYKTHHVRTTFGSSDVYFQVKMLKHKGFGPLLEG